MFNIVYKLIPQFPLFDAREDAKRLGLATQAEGEPREKRTFPRLRGLTALTTG